jgi:protein translocase SecG subunit
MLKIIQVGEIIIAIALTISKLIQNRGAGLSSTFGGDFGGYYRKRGFERFLVIFSSILAIIFVILAVISLIISN